MKKYLFILLASWLAVTGTLPAQLPLENEANQEALLDVLQVKRTRDHLHGTGATFHAFRHRLDDGQDGAGLFISDSTMRAGNAVPKTFADYLAARYPNHRVELRRAANDGSSFTTTVVQAGPLGPRYVYFPLNAAYQAKIPGTLASASPAGTAFLTLEGEVSIDAAGLSAGLPLANIKVVGFGTSTTPTVLELTASGRLEVSWRDSGGVYKNDNFQSSTLVAGGTLVAGTKYALRVTVNPDNGAGAREVKYYTSTDSGATWTQLGSTRGGTTSSFGLEAGSTYWIGSDGGNPTDYVRHYQAQVRIGTSQVPILPARMDLYAHASGQTTNTSELGGSPTIFIDQVAQDGATLITGGFFSGSGAGDFTTEAYRSMVNHFPDWICINTSHNDEVCNLPVDWETQMDAAVTAIYGIFPYDPPIIHTTQNPEPLDYADGALPRQHNQRQSWIINYAAKKGRDCVDIYQAFRDANDSSNSIPGDVHPSSAGYLLWGRTFWNCFLDGTNDTSANDKVIEFPAFLRRLPGEVETERLAA